MTFEDLKLTNPLLNALADMGLDTPTPIQQKAFSVILSGRDVVGIAQTGTGKTLAYLLPVLRQLSFSAQKEPRILIVVPTRELVVQVLGEIKKLTAYMTVRSEGVYGGTNINTQKALIAEGVDVLVGTPGRLMDLALCRALNLKSVRNFIIDEVDEMLSLGFRHQLTTLLDLLPRKRQNLMFSATLTEDVDELIATFFNAPVYVEPVRAGTPLERIRRRAYLVPNFYTKLNLLEVLLRSDESMTKVLIFGPSKRVADMIHQHLEQVFPDQFDLIHGNKSQNFRLNAVARFDQGACRGLIATDLLARGVDLSDVTHVINLDTPTEPESYIHRIGRTGRADREGEAILFFTEAERPQVEAIETLMGQAIPLSPLPEELVVSTKLTEEERYPNGEKNYLPPPPVKTGAFHEKSAKNKKAALAGKAFKAKKSKKSQKKKR